MKYQLFFSLLGLFSVTAAQQHDPHFIIDQLAQELAIKSYEFLEKSWEEYKKDHPNQPNSLGSCLEFDLFIIEKFKNADAAYTQFEATAMAPRLTVEYVQRKYELEHQKNIANLAVSLSSQLRAFMLKKLCEPKNKLLDR